MTSARRLLQKKDKTKFSKLDDRTIRCLVKKLETDCTLIKNTRMGRPEKHTLSEHPIISKMLKKKFVPALKRKHVLDRCCFMQDGAPPHCSKESLAWLEK